jgi:hypothetical protein
MKMRLFAGGLLVISVVSSIDVVGACYRLQNVNCCGYIEVGAYCIDGGCPPGTPCCRQFEANDSVAIGSGVPTGGSGKDSLATGPTPAWCKYRNPVCVLPEKVCVVGVLVESGVSPHVLAGADCSMPADPCPPSGCGGE